MSKSILPLRSRALSEREWFEQVERARRGAEGLRSVSEEKLITHALRLANLREGDWAQFADVYVRFELRSATVMSPGDDDSIRNMATTAMDPTTGNNWREQHLEVFEHFLEVGAGFREMLSIIRRDLPKARRTLPARIAQTLNGVIVVSHMEYRGGSLETLQYPYLPDVETAVAYVTALLLDESRPPGRRRTFGERLQQCAYGQDEAVQSLCERWFLAQSTEKGGKPSKYCSPEHAALARLTVTQRVAKHRAKQRVARPK